MENVFGPLISSYSRAQAIADGDLIDVSNTAKEAGFKVPVAIKRDLYHGYIVPSAEDVRNGQDTDGRLWDTLWMLLIAIKSGKNGKNGTSLNYPVSYVMKGENRIVTLKALSHPGDQHEHVITIMLLEEN